MSPPPLRLARVNALDEAAFTARFGGIAEDSPWVAAEAARRRPFATRDAMVAAFVDAVRGASDAARLALLRAHPDLATRLGALSADSRREQSGAGLDRLDAAARARFVSRNRAYRERFGFPFIFAVKGATAEQILEAFDLRLPRSIDDEGEAAIEQVLRIIRFRIEEQVEG